MGRSGTHTSRGIHNAVRRAGLLKALGHQADLHCFNALYYRAVTADLPNSPAFDSLKTPEDFHASGPFPLTSRANSACATSASSDNSRTQARYHSSATHADAAAPTPSTAEGREASTCGSNSVFRHWACPFTASLSATSGARGASRLQRLASTDVRPCKRPAASAGRRPLFLAPVAGTSEFPCTSSLRFEFWPRVEASREFETSVYVIRATDHMTGGPGAPGPRQGGG